MLKVWILVFVISTSSSSQSGASAVTAEFNGQKNCVLALNDLIKQANNDSSILVRGCYEK